ncbi:hypothetical protein CsSME_00040377 [Camellia sinensis var. sinensis]
MDTTETPSLRQISPSKFFGGPANSPSPTKKPPRGLGVGLPHDQTGTKSILWPWLDNQFGPRLPSPLNDIRDGLSIQSFQGQNLPYQAKVGHINILIRSLRKIHRV